ncbi:MAG: hypothetical protein PVI94_15980 [Desulfobacterales bacterium]
MMTSNKSVRRADFDYLRSYAVLLVLWHHATLAYSSVMVLIEENPRWQVNPVKHPVDWVPFDVLIVVNDRYFMPLLFFVAGLFV